MCNRAVASLIEDILEEKTQNADVFTAYDVTQTVRNETTDNVRHNDVRAILNNQFAQGGIRDYERELKTLDLPSSPQALVYFPLGKTADDYGLALDVDDTDADDTDDIDSIVVARLQLQKREESTSLRNSLIRLLLSMDLMTCLLEGHYIPRQPTKTVVCVFH